MNDLIYTVDYVTKITECKVQDCKRDFMRITEKILSQYPEYIRPFYNFIAHYRCEAMIKDEYVGKSVCSSADTFNERYGKDIARTKAIIKRENAFQETLEAIYEDIATLADINISIDREHVLDKHIDNMCALLENEKSLAAIRGYDKDDEYGIKDNIDLNRDYTPHCCSLCGKTFVNYTDDAAYEINEESWKVIETNEGTKIEMCPMCAEVIATLCNN